jgi:protease-4
MNMGQFFKFTLASILGFILAIFLLIIFTIGIVVSASTGEETAVVNQHSVLRMNLDYPINDRGSMTPPNVFNMSDFKLKADPGLNDILKSIEKAATDPNIDGIYLNVASADAGVAQLEEIRNALIQFKESGKFIVAYAEGYDQKGYYLASVADEVYVHPEGSLLFKGLGAQLMFFKGTLEKLDLEMQVIRHGKFKAAVEPFLLDKMSDANREQTTALISSVWDNLLQGISQSRNISIADLNQTADKLLLDDPKQAVKLHFVDGLKYSDEIAEILKEKSGKAIDDNLDFVTVSDYITSNYFNEQKVAKDKIAVIYATGEIKNGKGDDTYIGEKNIRKAIIKARKDKRVKAIVLRVNSPGGSALVSDLIWREVVLTKEKKPVVVSMGDVAASGGYYISCAADYIFAEPTTITGSIGVFGLIPNTGKFMTNKLGITFDEAKTNENSNFMSTTNKSLSPFQHDVIQKSVERVYDSFITKVAEGRNMAKADVDRIGQGRVWAGAQAIKIGLVDELGGLNNAIAKAADLAHVDTYKIKSLPIQKEPLQEIIENITGNSSSVLLRNMFGVNYKYVEMMQSWQDRDVLQARMPYEMIIQ